MRADERILITGASGAIGGEIAIACAERGAWPLIGYRSQQAQAAKVLARCGRGQTCRVDLTEAAIEAPAVDAVVHCAAAFAGERSLLAAGDDLTAQLITANVIGPLRLTRAAAAHDRLKRVVFILSSASFCRGTGPYALSKAAELQLCRLLANELAPRGVRVDAIVPGWTATAMAGRAATAIGQNLAAVAEQHLGGELLSPIEIGELCATLLFDHADEPPGNLIVWDRRDSIDPVWHALIPDTASGDFFSGERQTAN